MAASWAKAASATPARTPAPAPQLAADVVRERLTRINQLGGDLRIDLIGLNSLHQTAEVPVSDSADIRLHVALRSTDRDDIDTMLWEVESLLCCGPAGGGGYRGQVTPCVVTHSALIARDQVSPTFRDVRRMTQRRIHDIAHARAGDKGNTSNVSVWVTTRKTIRC